MEKCTKTRGWQVNTFNVTNTASHLQLCSFTVFLYNKKMWLWSHGPIWRRWLAHSGVQSERQVGGCLARSHCGCHLAYLNHVLQNLCGAKHWSYALTELVQRGHLTVSTHCYVLTCYVPAANLSCPTSPD